MKLENIHTLSPEDLLASLAKTLEAQSEEYKKLRDLYLDIASNANPEVKGALDVLSSSFGSRSGEFLRVSSWLDRYLRMRGRTPDSIEYIEDLFA